MKRFGRVWCFGDDVNTDLIQPSRYVLLPIEQQASYAFEATRPGWAAQVRIGDIIVAGKNFGTGSGRPAVLSLRTLGIAAIACESINGVFFRNCVNYAFPALAAPGVAAVFHEGDVADLDLRSGAVRNMSTGNSVRGRPWHPSLLNILEAGGLIEQLRAEGLLVDA